MSPEPFRDVKESTLLRSLSDLAGDFADLLQKELRLARAEITENLSTRFQAGVWMAAAGVIAFLGVLILLEAIIFGLIELGLSPFWSALSVAIVLGFIAGASYYKGRLDAEKDLTPRRALRQVKEDIRTTKEQLS